MLYYFLYSLKDEAAWLGWLNVVRYIPFRLIAAWLTSMIVCFAVYPWFIKRLQERQIGQPVRDDGPASHFSKAGTPTMGGSLILLALVLSTVLWADIKNQFIWLTGLTIFISMFDAYADAHLSGGPSERKSDAVSFEVGPDDDGGVAAALTYTF